MTRFYYEDFPVGHVMQIGKRTVTAAEIIEFALQFDPQPFHVDEKAAKESVYGGLIASGWHTCSMAMRMMCNAYLLDSASMGSGGMDEVRWLKPVRPGDTLRGQSTTLEARVSETRPERGFVTSRWEMFNQNDELVMTMRGMGMFLRRAPS